MKSEEKFYFLRPGQIARDNDLMRHHRRMLVNAIMRARDVGLIDIPEFEAAVAAMNDRSSIPNQKLANLEAALTKAIKEEGFSRPGQPERFQIGGNNSRAIQTVVSAIEKAISLLSQLPGDQSIKGPIAKIMQQLFVAQESARAISRGQFSRPGQPDKFDASSLERGSFAEASKSPILGKLLAAKVMPDGGWRAVQVGSDTLVISFEDADLARDFGQRASSKGYSATSPVATTGRYWNVEVKNGN